MHFHATPIVLFYLYYSRFTNIVFDNFSISLSTISLFQEFGYFRSFVSFALRCRKISQLDVQEPCLYTYTHRDNVHAYTFKYIGTSLRARNKNWTKNSLPLQFIQLPHNRGSTAANIAVTRCELANIANYFLPGWQRSTRTR